VKGGVNADASVACARTACDKAHAGRAAQFSVRFCHERRAAFLTTTDDAHAMRSFFVIQRVQYIQKTFTGNGENSFDSVNAKLIDQDAGSGSHPIHFPNSSINAPM
jgi:hypothetical protein